MTYMERIQAVTRPGYLNVSKNNHTQKHQSMNQIITEKAEIRIATKQLVDALIDMNRNNRSVKKSVVEKYRRDIASGNWHLTNQGIGVCEDGILADGQHRLLAIKAENYPPVKLLIVWGLSNESRMAIDTHAKRNVRDLLQFAFGHRVNAVAAAIANMLFFNKHGWPSIGATPAELYDIIGEVDDIMEEIVNTPSNAQFYPAPFLAGFVYAANEKIASVDTIKKMMIATEDGLMLSRDDPCYHLRNLLFGRRREVSTAARREKFQKTVKAVIAYAEGKKMGTLRA
jgi:hypothetical protein